MKLQISKSSSLIIVLLINCCFLSHSIYGQYEVWEKQYLSDDEGAMNYPVDQIADSSGNLYITGYEKSGADFSIVTFKVNWKGEVEWTSKYSGQDFLNCQAKEIKLDKDNNPIVLGFNFINESGLDIITIKYDKNGKLLWQNSYSSEGYLNDYPKSLAIDDNSNIYVVGETAKPNTINDIVMLKYSYDGTLAWSKNFETVLINNDFKRRIFIKNSSVISLGIGDTTKLLYLAYNFNGELVKTFKYNFNVSLTDITDYTIDEEANVYLLGTWKDPLSSNIQIKWIVQKIPTYGEMEWERNLYESHWINDEIPMNIIVRNNGKFLVTGNAFEGIPRYRTELLRLFEIDKQGNVILGQKINDVNQTKSDGYSIDPENNIYFIVTDEIPSVPITLSILKLSSDYQPRWKTPIKLFYSLSYLGLDTIPLLISTNRSNCYLSKTSNPNASHIYFTRITEILEPEKKVQLNSVNILADSALLTWTDLGTEYSYRIFISKDSIDFFKNLVIDQILDQNNYTFFKQEVSNKYFWKIYAFNYSGLASPSEIGTFEFNLLNISTKDYVFRFNLSQNYPNPFNPSTKISYQIPHSGFVSLKIYDLLGREVAILVNEEKPAGSYEVEFSAEDGYSFGIYFYKLQTENYSSVKKMIFLK